MTTRCSSIREWRAGFGRQMFNLDFEPLTDAPFHASFDSLLDGMRIVRAAFSPGLTVRSDELAKDGDDDFGLVIAQSKHLSAQQRGQELHLSRGEATLLRVSDAGAVGASEHFGFVTIMVPFAELEERARGAGNLAARRIPLRSEPLSLLRGYIRSAEKNWQGASADVRDAVRRHFTDLVALAVMRQDPIGDSQISPVVAARLAVALDYIATHFQDPALSVTAVARRIGISPRYLQRILEASGTSFSDRLNELRLQKVLELLTVPHVRPRRILDVALSSGFSDISHFNRLFRARFGETPTKMSSGPRKSQ